MFNLYMAGALLAGASLASTEYPPAALEALVRDALSSHPALEALRAEVDAAHTYGAHHAAWKPPEAFVSFFNAPVSAFPNPVGGGQREIDYTLSQRIPFPGKQGALAAPEHARAYVLDMYVEVEALRLRRAVLVAYADLYEADWMLRLTRETLSDARELAAATRSGYASGRNGQADALRAEVEAARLEAVVIDAVRRRAEARASLLALTGGDSAVVSGLAAELPVPATVPDRDWRSLAENRRPELEAARREMGMAEAEVRAMRSEALPDLMLEGMYKDMRGGMEDSWAVKVGAEIPLAPWSWTGVRSGVRRARLLERKAGREEAATRRVVVEETARATALLEAARGREEIARMVRLPVAQRARASALAEYRGGAESFSDALMAARELREAREEAHRARADFLRAWAGLEQATGGRLVETVSPAKPGTKEGVEP